MMKGIMLRYDDANEILMGEFEAMKTAFQEDGEGFYDDIQHCFYDDKFVPYIVRHINEGNEGELKKIFDFVERLFSDGDEDLVELAGVSIVEPIYYEPDYEKHKGKIFSLCGNLTRKSFEGMDGE